ncbi:hypothetical protein LDENG_00228700, partial [Lucifuga dentata]
ESVHSVVGLNGTFPLQQDRSSVQTVISPEHCEAGFLIAIDQGPALLEHASLLSFCPPVNTDLCLPSDSCLFPILDLFA